MVLYKGPLFSETPKFYETRPGHIGRMEGERGKSPPRQGGEGRGGVCGKPSSQHAAKRECATQGAPANVMTEEHAATCGGFGRRRGRQGGSTISGGTEAEGRPDASTCTYAGELGTSAFASTFASAGKSGTSASSIPALNPKP